jgi:hypothetical protein
MNVERLGLNEGVLLASASIGIVVMVDVEAAINVFDVSGYLPERNPLRNDSRAIRIWKS